MAPSSQCRTREFLLQCCSDGITLFRTLQRTPAWTLQVPLYPPITSLTPSPYSSNHTGQLFLEHISPRAFAPSLSSSNSLTASKSQLRCYLLRELPHPHYSGFQPLPRSLLRTGPTYFPVSVGKHAKRLHPQPVFAGWFYVNLTQAVVPERRAPQLRKCLYKTELQASL